MKFRLVKDEYEMLGTTYWAALGLQSPDNIIAVFSHYSHAEYFCKQNGFKLIQVTDG